MLQRVPDVERKSLSAELIPIEQADGGGRSVVMPNAMSSRQLKRLPPQAAELGHFRPASDRGIRWSPLHETTTTVGKRPAPDLHAVRRKPNQ
jgi:hypothetical protein